MASVCDESWFSAALNVTDAGLIGSAGILIDQWYNLTVGVRVRLRLSVLMLANGHTGTSTYGIFETEALVFLERYIFGNHR